MFLLPLINTRALRQRLSHVTSQLTLSSILPSPVQSALGLSSDHSNQKSRVRRGKYWSFPLDQCAICHEDASLNVTNAGDALNTLSTSTYTSTSVDPPEESENAAEEPPPHPISTPYVASCGHTYCYVCLTTRMVRTADDRTGVGPGGTRWECLRCGDGVVGADRVEVELEEFGSEFGSSISMGGIDYTDDYDSSTMEFTDMSGSMASGEDENSD